MFTLAKISGAVHSQMVKLLSVEHSRAGSGGVSAHQKCTPVLFSKKSVQQARNGWVRQVIKTVRQIWKGKAKMHLRPRHKPYPRAQGNLALSLNVHLPLHYYRHGSRQQIVSPCTYFFKFKCIVEWLAIPLFRKSTFLCSSTEVLYQN